MSGSIADTTNRVTKLWATNIESTNLPTVNGGTLATALGLGSAANNNTGDFLAYNATAVNSSLLENHNAAYFQTALTNPVTGTGTTNYLPKLTGASTIGNSLIYDNGTKVGIGTTTPQGLLSIAGGDVYIDSSDQNAGTLPNGSVGPGLRFGGVSTGEGIASNRTDTAGNQYGLDFYTSYINRMAITNTGNVGIGTTAPSGIFHVSTDSTADMYFDRYGGAPANIIFRRANGTAAVPTAVGLDNQLFAIGGRGWGTTGFSAAGRVAVFGAASETWTDSSQGAYLAFNTTQIGTATAVERLRIIDSGNVGIGTTAPGYALDVNGFISASGEIHSIGNNARISLYRSTGINYFDWASGQPLYFGTETDVNGTNRSNKMSILDNGSVGIGTTNPLNKLHVEGTGGAAAGIYINSAAPASGTYTLYNNGGILYWNGNLLSTGSGSALTGSGTSNYLSKWTSDSVIGTSSIYDNGTNVGIGTTDPGVKLQVKGSSGSNTSISAVNNDYVVGSVGTGIYMSTGAASGDTFGFIQADKTGSTANADLVLQRYGGNVGIGTTSPAGKLEIAQSTGTDYFRISRSGFNSYGFSSTNNGISNGLNIFDITNSASRMFIDNNGNIGIGTTGPSSLLSVGGAGSSSYAISGIGTNSGIYGTATNAYTGVYGVSVGADGAGKGVYGVASGGVGGYFSSTSGYGLIVATGNVGIGTTGPNEKLTISAGNILLRNTSAVSTSQGIVKFANPSYLTQYGGIEGRTNAAADQMQLAFYTSGNSGVPSEKMTILADGNVGIGTTAPIVKLDISGGTGDAAAYDPQLALSRWSSTGNNQAFKFRLVANATDPTIWGDLNILRKSTASSAESDSYYTSALYVNGKNGNVGIGTTGPSSRLQVYGPETWGFGEPLITMGDGTGVLGISKVSSPGLGLPAASVFMQHDSSVVGSGIGFVTNNGTNINPRMFITRTGNVGIGTTGPGTKLEISDPSQTENAYGLLYINKNWATNNPALVVRQSGAGGNSGNIQGLLVDVAGTPGGKSFEIQNAGTARVTVLNNGNVGIGTTNPGAKLHISTSASGANFLSNGIMPNSARTLLRASASITTTDLTAATGPVVGLNFENSSNTDGTYSPLITWSRKSQDALYDTVYAYMGGYAVETGGNNSWLNGDLVFGTTNYTDTIERMRIKGNGNVGIGTTDPSSPLHVKGVGDSFTLRLESSNTVGPGLTFQGSGAYDGKMWAMIAGGSGNPIGANKFAIYDLTAGLARIVIDTNGNVGIGTSDPSTYKLYVNGTGYLGTTAWAYASDRRLKENITYLPDDGGLEKILALKPAKFDYIAGEKGQLGFIAQEVQEIIPEAVVITNQTTGMLGLKTEFITPYLVKAIQEMNLKLEDISSLDTTKATSLGSLITRFLADVGNGIGDIFVKQVNTDKLCVSDTTGAKTCINKAQLDSLMANAGGSLGDTTCVSPSIIINGVCTAPTPTPTPTTILVAAKATASAKVVSDYTAGSWTTFQTALATALELSEASDAEMTTKTAAINTAIAGLTPKTSTPTLSDIGALATAKGIAQGLIDAHAAESETPGTHIAGSLATLTAANAAANGTTANTQAVIDGQVSTLNTAIGVYNAAIVPN